MLNPAIYQQKKWLCMALSIMLLSGCTEVIDLELKSDPIRLVVDGILTNQSELQVVKLSQSAPYFSSTPALPVSDAIVTISDGSNIYVLTESNQHPGHYYISTDIFQPAPGNTYNLDITNVDLKGDNQIPHYTATATMPEPVLLDSMNLKLSDKWDLWQVLAWFQDPPEVQNYYLFRVLVNDMLFTRIPRELKFSDDRFFNGNYVNGVWVQSIFAGNNRKVEFIGTTFTLELCSITSEFYDFLYAIELETSSRSPFFSGPPANIQGNISNGALGIFTAIAIDKASVDFDPEIHNQ
jgi:hypothetical protein